MARIAPLMLLPPLAFAALALYPLVGGKYGIDAQVPGMPATACRARRCTPYDRLCKRHHQRLGRRNV